jgi:hypothetical protein
LNHIKFFIIPQADTCFFQGRHINKVFQESLPGTLFRSFLTLFIQGRTAGKCLLQVFYRLQPFAVFHVRDTLSVHLSHIVL